MGGIVTARIASGFAEHEAEPRIKGMPLSHMSVEVGHLYTEDYERDDESLVAYLSRIADWLEALTATTAKQLGPAKPRMSTCFLIDDHYGSLPEPVEVIPRLLRLAERAGLRIDYLARESGCVTDGDLEIASMVAARLVDEPPPGTNGSRPPTSVSGWLTNGQRSPATNRPAMSVPTQWQPPSENAEAPHSVFLDVELWDTSNNGRRYSCAFLAAVWQLLRLGLLRDNGEVIAGAEPLPPKLADTWNGLPVVMQVGRRCAPFAAFRSMSIMDTKFLKVEQAVRTILGSVAAQAEINDQLAERAEREGLFLPAEIVDRIQYLFTGPAWRLRRAGHLRRRRSGRVAALNLPGDDHVEVLGDPPEHVEAPDAFLDGLGLDPDAGVQNVRRRLQIGASRRRGLVAEGVVEQDEVVVRVRADPVPLDIHRVDDAYVDAAVSMLLHDLDERADGVGGHVEHEDALNADAALYGVLLKLQVPHAQVRLPQAVVRRPGITGVHRGQAGGLHGRGHVPR